MSQPPSSQQHDHQTGDEVNEEGAAERWGFYLRDGVEDPRTVATQSPGAVETDDDSSRATSDL